MFSCVVRAPNLANTNRIENPTCSDIYRRKGFLEKPLTDYAMNNSRC